MQVEEVNGVEAGLMQDAQRFFVLTQTDNLWKEHLQAIKFVQQVRPVLFPFVFTLAALRPVLKPCGLVFQQIGTRAIGWFCHAAGLC